MKPHPFDNEPDWWIDRRRSYEDEPFEEQFYAHGPEVDEFSNPPAQTPAARLELTEEPEERKAA